MTREPRPIGCNPETCPLCLQNADRVALDETLTDLIELAKLSPTHELPPNSTRFLIARIEELRTLLGRL